MMNKKTMDSSLPARRRWSNASTTMAGHSGGSTSRRQMVVAGKCRRRKNLTYNLEEYARTGMGAVEITPIYGVQGNDANGYSVPFSPLDGNA